LKNNNFIKLTLFEELLIIQMNFLPTDIEDIINDYKICFETVDKYQRQMKTFKKEIKYNDKKNIIKKRERIVTYENIDYIIEDDEEDDFNGEYEAQVLQIIAYDKYEMHRYDIEHIEPMTLWFGGSIEEEPDNNYFCHTEVSGYKKNYKLKDIIKRIKLRLSFIF
jgi:hypothetical protein